MVEMMGHQLDYKKTLASVQRHFIMLILSSSFLVTNTEGSLTSYCEEATLWKGGPSPFNHHMSENGSGYLLSFKPLDETGHRQLDYNLMRKASGQKSHLSHTWIPTKEIMR